MKTKWHRFQPRTFRFQCICPSAHGSRAHRRTIAPAPSPASFCPAKQGRPTRSTTPCHEGKKRCRRGHARRRLLMLDFSIGFRKTAIEAEYLDLAAEGEGSVRSRRSSPPCRRPPTSQSSSRPALILSAPIRQIPRCNIFASNHVRNKVSLLSLAFAHGITRRSPAKELLHWQRTPLLPKNVLEKLKSQNF